MLEDESKHLPPLQGCLYCHSEGTTVLTEGRRILGFGSPFPILKCGHCGSTAFLDYDAGSPDAWRIRYRRVNRTPRYYYAAIYLGRAGWLSARDALNVSTNAYAQRMRVAQTKAGDLTWLQPDASGSVPFLMAEDEKVYLTLKGVTLQSTPPGILVRAAQGAVLDSGKFYLTDQNLRLLGQRRDWLHSLEDIEKVEYDDKSWIVYLDTPEGFQHYRGVNSTDQLDAQLIAAVIETLSRSYSK